MNQMQRVLKALLQNLDVIIPDSDIRRLLDTPVGTSLRGISDALDSLYIENSVYQLPKKYLKELDYPYLMVLPDQKEAFAVVTNDKERDAAIPKWDGVVLAVQKTQRTPIYKYVWARNIIGNIKNNQLILIITFLIVTYSLFYWPSLLLESHITLSALGLWISTILINKDYIGEKQDKFCKIGKTIDCEQVLNSKGSQFFGILKMSDLAFLFYSTLILLSLIANDYCQGYAFILLLIGCIFTLYSVIYQTVAIKKVCLYCMSINLIVWLDTAIFILNYKAISLHSPFPFILSGCIAYMVWLIVSHYLGLTAHNSSFMSKVSALYNRDLFDWLLSKERTVEDIDNNYADVDGVNEGDVITIFVHPDCMNCKKTYKYIPELRKRAIVKTVSLTVESTELHEYCKKNQIKKTPTIVFNGKELPKIYGLEDLKYII